jgi:hypothetical protein
MVPSLDEIAKKFRNLTSKNIDKGELLQQLVEAERTGLISSRIINKQDEPIKTWKTNIN